MFVFVVCFSVIFDGCLSDLGPGNYGIVVKTKVFYSNRYDADMFNSFCFVLVRLVMIDLGMG